MKFKALIALVISLTLAANGTPRSQSFGGGGGSSGSGLLHIVTMDSIDISNATTPFWSTLVTTTLGSSGWPSAAYLNIQCLNCWGLGNNASLKIQPYGYPAETTESQRDDGSDDRLKLVAQNTNAANATASGVTVFGVIQIADSSGGMWITGQLTDATTPAQFFSLPPQIAFRISAPTGAYKSNAKIVVKIHFMR